MSKTFYLKDELNNPDNTSICKSLQPQLEAEKKKCHKLKKKLKNGHGKKKKLKKKLKASKKKIHKLEKCLNEAQTSWLPGFLNASVPKALDLAIVSVDYLRQKNQHSSKGTD